MTKKKLLRKIEALEIETNHRTAVVLALVHAVKPTNTFRFHYRMYAINNQFGAADVHGIDAYFRWADRREDLESARAFYGLLSRDDLIEAFDEMVPTRKGKLEEILHADRADGEVGEVWRKWARIVLDREPRPQQSDDDTQVPSEKDESNEVQS